MAERVRVLGLVSRPWPLTGGAQQAFSTLLAQLRRRGHNVAIAGLGPIDTCGRASGVTIHVYSDAEALSAFARRWRPDVLVSSLDDSVAAARLAERFSVPHVLWAQSFELSPPSPTEAAVWGVAADREYASVADRRRVLTSADAIFANSRFLQGRLRAFGARAVDVLYPPIDARVVRRGPSRPFPPPDQVVSVAGYAYKGADVILDLARRLPHVPFVIAGRIVEPWRRAAAELSNVSLPGFVAPRVFLARARVVLVPSRWPEPFGRVAVEAGANGIPVLTSRTGGLPEACGIRALSVARFRSVDAWHEALTRLLADPARAAALGRHARRYAARFLGDTSARRLERVVRRLAQAGRPDWRRSRVVLVGPRATTTAFAAVNDAWSQTRAAARRWSSASPDEARAQDADVFVHHDYTAPFGAWRPPATGLAVAVRTWDFGPYPRPWIDHLDETYDALWVYSTWTRQQAIAGGLAPDRVAVVPLGVDAAVFHPRGPQWRPAGAAGFTFLFVGAPVLRKGIDVLLTAYRRAFSRADDVTLVIKANPRDLFYTGITLRSAIASIARDATAPRVALVDRFLSPRRLAALYRSADVTVFPYRAEGFGLPILESMACGRPAVVPAFGAALDLCTPASAFLVPARRIAAPVGRMMPFNTLGFEADVDRVDFCEIDPDQLAATLRAVAGASAAMLRRVGAAARQRALAFTWDASREAAERALARLERRGPPIRIARARARAAEGARRLDVATSLYVGTSPHGPASKRP